MSQPCPNCTALLDALRKLRDDCQSVLDGALSNDMDGMDDIDLVESLLTTINAALIRTGQL